MIPVVIGCHMTDMECRTPIVLSVRRLLGYAFTAHCIELIASGVDWEM